MCSIAGSTNKDEVKRMLSIQKHRAPDGAGVFSDDKYTIGNGRLAIVDVKAVNVTPFFRNPFCITFNGEIYNYRELREELEREGYSFETNTDTEVLLVSYIKWGVGCLEKLNGMFAFAIYDGNEIFAARDIAGEKPFYYTEEPFRFASEAKALDFVCKELPPAHYLVYDFKNIKVERWWNLKQFTINNPEEELESLLEDSIKIRTTTEVPYALYYSGGVDSSLISTFRIFENLLTYEDLDFEIDYKRSARDIVWHLDYPVRSFSAYGLWVLAKKARLNGIKVVISGEGADELFGGYVRFLPDALYEQARKKFPSYKTMFPVKKTLEDWCWEEFNGNMRELLRMGDRMAGAWGVENRCPFLDKRIIELAFNLSFSDRIDGFEMKSILRRILRRRNPEYKEIEKTGLYCSVNKWLGVGDKLEKSRYLEYQEAMLRVAKKDHEYQE